MFTNSFCVKDAHDLQLLEEHWKYRLCPTVPVLNDPNHKDNVEKHIAKCPECREAKNNQEFCQAIECLGRLLEDKTEPAPDLTLAIGQVWSLTPELEGWDTELNYISAPLVLIVELDDYYCRVVPLHDSFEFLAPQDILVSHASENLNAEVWNSFAVHTKHLDKHYSTIEKDVLAFVLSKMDQGFEPSSDPAIQAFMDIEFRVSYFIAMNALGLLMHEYEELSRGK